MSTRTIYIHLNSLHKKPSKNLILRGNIRNELTSYYEQIKREIDLTSFSIGFLSAISIFAIIGHIFKWYT